MVYNVTIDGAEHRVELDLAAGQWRCLLDGREVEMNAVLVRPDVLSLLVEGRAYEIRREQVDGNSRVWVGDQLYSAAVRDPKSLRGRQLRADHDKGVRRLLAPMPGKVIRFLVRENSPVEAGQGVVVVEAMKMQNEIKSPKKGTVLRLAVTEGAAVSAGDVLAIVE